MLRTTGASTTTDVGRGHRNNRLAPKRSADERALVARFAAGDHDAVAELYTRYSRPLYTVAMSVLRDSERARDCVQESFVKAWQAAATIDPTRPISPWLYAIARRTAIDILRRESRAPGKRGNCAGRWTSCPRTSRKYCGWRTSRAARTATSRPGSASPSAR